MRSALLWYQSQTRRDFPGSPVIKTASSAGDAGSISSEGAKISHADQRNQISGRSNIVTNSIKTLWMIHIKKIYKKWSQTRKWQEKKITGDPCQACQPSTTPLPHYHIQLKISYNFNLLKNLATNSLLLTRNLTKNTGLISAYCVCYAYYILYSYNKRS